VIYNLKMSLEQYKKCLKITENLLFKLELPSHTIAKYKHLKNKIMSSKKVRSTEEVVLGIKDEILAVYELFMDALLKVFENFSSSHTAKDEEVISQFFDQFEVQKKNIRQHFYTVHLQDMLGMKKEVY